MSIRAAVVCLLFQVPLDPALLRVGEVFEGTFHVDAREVHTETIDALPTRAPTVGAMFQVRVEESGAYRIEMLSYAVDAYLVLRDDAGRVLAEDDDGLISTHARIACELEAGALYLVDACALHGQRGAYQLELIEGPAPVLSAVQRRQAELEEARRRLQAVEDAEGSDGMPAAMAMNRLGLLLEEQGRLAEALPLFERALAICEDELGPEHAFVASAANNLAHLLQGQGEYAAAYPLYERALAIWETAHGPEHPEVARGLNNLAILLQNEGRYAEARELFERTLAILQATTGSEVPEFALTLNNLGAVLAALGDPVEARRCYERAMSIMEQVLGPEHPRVASSVANLGELLHSQGLHDEARALHERGLAIREKAYGPRHPSVANSLFSLGKVLDAQGEYSEAQQLYERALTIWEQTLGSEHRQIAKGLASLGISLRLQGRDGEARPFFERALAISEKALGPDHPDVAPNIEALGLLLRDQGHYAEARPLLERALAIRETALGSDHPLAAHVNGLASTLADLGETEAAWDLVRRVQGGGRARLERQLAGLSEQESYRFLSSLLWQLELVLSLERTLGRSSATREAYEQLTRSKGRVTRLLAAGRAESRDALSDEQQEVLAAIRRTQNRLSALFSDDRLDPDRRRERVERLIEERNALELRWRRSMEPVTRDEPAYRDLVASLPPRSALLDFFIHRLYRPARFDGETLIEKGAWTEPHLTAWVVRAGSDVPVRIDLGPARTVQESLTSPRADAVALRGVPVGTGVPLRTLGVDPRRLLWDPIAAWLEDEELLFVSPDGFLGTLPLEVLQLADGSYLLEHYSFVYLQDLALLVESAATGSTRDRADASLLSVGGLQFARATEPVTEAASRDHSGVWPELPHAAEEARLVADLYASTHPEGERLLLRGAEATEERLSVELSRHSIAHVATHGYFQPRGAVSSWDSARAESRREDGSPAAGPLEDLVGHHPGLLSGLVCSGAGTPALEGAADGYLTAAEVGWLDLSGLELVVLSACETGLGEERSGEGLIGLRRAFHTAGAKTVISSLWSVKDRTTSELMQDFYEGLWVAGLGKREALRAAQLAMLRRNRAENGGDGLPETWGAFVLSGEWR